MNKTTDSTPQALAVANGSAPLFIPLKREYFEAFERGEKTEEYRMYWRQWNGKNCRVGRPVVLSLGYGKQRRLQGTISAFRVEKDPQTLPGWKECYGQSNHPACVIGITLQQNK